MCLIVLAKLIVPLHVHVACYNFWLMTHTVDRQLARPASIHCSVRVDVRTHTHTYIYICMYVCLPVCSTAL